MSAEITPFFCPLCKIEVTDDRRYPCPLTGCPIGPIAEPGKAAALILTSEESAAIIALWGQRSVKFTEIMALLARDLGAGELSSLSEQQAAAIREEAEEVVRLWSGDADMIGDTLALSPAPSIVPTTSLQHLLRDHFELGEQINDIEETALERRTRHYTAGYYLGVAALVVCLLLAGLWIG